MQGVRSENPANSQQPSWQHPQGNVPEVDKRTRRHVRSPNWFGRAFVCGMQT